MHSKAEAAAVAREGRESFVKVKTVAQSYLNGMSVDKTHIHVSARRMSMGYIEQAMTLYMYNMIRVWRAFLGERRLDRMGEVCEGKNGRTELKADV